VAWLAAVALTYRNDAPMPMRNGSLITKASNPALYRFWMAAFALLGLAGLFMLFGGIWEAV
jgi:hypothetical protein